MIRRFHNTDMDQLIAIWLEASIQAHDFVERGFWESKTGDMREVYLPSAETYVFEENGVIKGFISLSGDTLAALFVSPAYQRTGIGTQLMAKSKEMRKRLTLKVFTENSRGVAFYLKCGFETLYERIDEHTGHPELVMTFNSW